MQNNSKVRYWSIWILFVIATMALVGCGDPAVDSEKMLQTAKDYIAKNSPRKATLELKNALQANPENAEARYRLGLLNLEFGDTAGAEKEFRRAMQAGWNEEEVQIGLARAAVNGNDFKKMIEVIEIKDHYSATVRANLHGLRASALAGLGLRDQADQALSEGMSLDANAFQIRKIAIQLKLLDGDYKAARNQLVEALEFYPDNPELLLLSGITAMKSGDLQAGITANQRVIELGPSNIVTIYGRQARLRLARVQILEKQFEEAAATLKPLFRLYANDLETNYLGGLLAFGKGNLDLAEERLHKVLKVAPDHIQTQLLFGTVSYQQKNYEQAAHYLSRYISAVPGNLGARKLLGRAYMMLGQNDKAQAVFHSALENDVQDAELLALVGLSDLREGNTASGIESLEKAVQAAPDNVGLRNQLAKAYIQSGEAEQAVKELNVILKQDSGRKNTEVLLVLAHLKAGSTEKAIDTSLKILAENPDNPAAMILVGNVFVATGDRIEARNYYDKALTLQPENPQARVSLAQLEEAEGNLTDAAAMYEGMVNEGMKTTIPLLALARLAEKQGNKQEMVDWLEQARVQAPEQLQARLILAESYLRGSELLNAELVIKESLELAPKNPKVLALWGRLLLAGQHYNKALPPLKELVEVAPNSDVARVLLAETYLKLGRVEDARRELNSAIEHQPDSLAALSLLTRTEIQLGEFEQAEGHALQIQKLNPNLYMGYELSGDSWFGRKEYAEAEEAYRAALERRPSSNLAVKRSITATRLGKQDERIDILQTWLQDHGDDISALQFLGTTYQEMGQHTQAIDTYEKVLSLKSDNLVALNNLAWLYSLEHNPKALGLAEKAYQAKPEDGGVKDTFGWILIQNGQLDKGRRLVKQALEMLPGVAEIRYHYAVALIKTGEKQEGTKLMKELLAENVQFQGREDAEKMISLP